MSEKYIRRTCRRPLEERIITFNYHRESINYFNQNHPSQNIENLTTIAKLRLPNNTYERCKEVASAKNRICLIQCVVLYMCLCVEDMFDALI